MSTARCPLAGQILRVSTLLLTSAAMGCASLSVPDLSFRHARVELGDAKTVEPQGPGSLFETPRAAALDALAYAYLQSRRIEWGARRARGGTVHAAGVGFTYDEPAVARRGSRRVLRYRLLPSDVAHFRFEPSDPVGPFVRPSNRLERQVRRFVERRDPVHRPVYYLAADRYLRVYEADAGGERSLARIGFGTRRAATELAMSPVRDTAGPVLGQPLALQPIRTR